ncbi:hypothetical protein [Streptomyces sp. PU-14G]
MRRVSHPPVAHGDHEPPRATGRAPRTGRERATGHEAEEKK